MSHQKARYWTRHGHPSRVPRLVAAASVALTLTGCATSTEPRSAAPTVAGHGHPSTTARFDLTQQPFHTRATVPPGSPTVPWNLIRIDQADNRVYIHSASADCATPTFAHLQTTPTTIRITVYANPAPATPPNGHPTACALKRVDTGGYLTIPTGIHNRTILGAT